MVAVEEVAEIQNVNIRINKYIMKQMSHKLSFLSVILIVIAVVFSFFLFSATDIPFRMLGADTRYEKIIRERNLSINQAMVTGNYNCCMNPPCEMCYMDANEWNNETAGTCACDDLVSEGKEPCPQCRKSDLCENDVGSCSLNKE